MARGCSKALVAVLFSLSCLAGCQPRPQAADLPAAASGPWPGFDYAAAAVGKRFRIDVSATEIDVIVRRAGPLARFGHDHVVSATDPQGFLLLDDPAAANSRADLRFAVRKLVVDAEPARQRYGLGGAPDAEAVAGTRENLMRHVLQPDAWPWITIGLRALQRQDIRFSAETTIEVNGRQWVARLPFRLEQANDRVIVDTEFTLPQTDLGLQPFSTLGGGLQVADAMDIHVHIEAVTF